MHKIAHIADIHFRGYKRHAEYRQAMEQFFAICRTEKPDAFVVAGDIVHSKTQNITPELIDILSWWFTEMADIAPVHIALGNHDGLLTNLSRQDTVSPIVSALNNPRLHLHKASGVYPILDGAADLVVFSPFDEQNWQDLKNYQPRKDAFSIGVFHGPVTGCQSDSNWSLDGDVDVAFFEALDFAMLGDIHKRQDLDAEGRVAYPGSMIQQNFGEERSKGFLLWEIESRDKWEKQFVELDPVQPYVTIDWQGDLNASINKARIAPEELVRARIRIRSESPLSQVETREIAKNLRNACGAHEVYFKHDAITRQVAPSAEDAVTVIERDPNSLTKMLVDLNYVQADDQATLEAAREIIRQTAAKCSITDAHGGKTWTLNRMSWDNTYGYGENNTINFSKLSGLIGVFGPNRAGKSSIPATVLYNLFNSSDRGLGKNLDIINVRKEYCNASMDFHVGSARFLAERQSVKKVNRKGEASAVTHLNLAQIDGAGKVAEDLNGEQRRDTDKELFSLLGSVEDFVLTAFATQGDGNNFISAGPTARKEILARFLQLDFFGEMYERFRDESSGIRKTMFDAQSTIEQSDPAQMVAEVRELRSKRDKIRDQIKNAQKQLDEISDSIAPDHRQKLDAIEKRDRLRKRIEQLSKQHRQQCIEQGKLQSELNLAKADIATNAELRGGIDLEALRAVVTSHTQLSASHEQLTLTVENKKQYYDSLKKSVNLLKKVPCGDQFPKCRFIKDSHANRDKMADAAHELKQTQGELRAVKKAINAIDVDAAKQAIKTARRLDEECVNLERSSIKLSGTMDRIKIAIQKLESDVKAMEAELNLLEAKWNFDEPSPANDPSTSIMQHINALQTAEEKCSEMIGSKTQEIKQLKKLIESVETMRHDHDAYEALMKAFSKNGIPAQLVTSSLPVINKRLSETLFEDCGFAITLESDEASKKLDVFIDYGDSKRKIECASGMEKMIASLALRTALHSITHLPKPDFMILDEGFGALDDSNVEVCMKMLRSMLDHFRFILIISHVDTVKESVDEMIEVTRVGLDSRVQHV